MSIDTRSRRDHFWYSLPSSLPAGARSRGTVKNTLYPCSAVSSCQSISSSKVFRLHLLSIAVHLKRD